MLAFVGSVEVLDEVDVLVGVDVEVVLVVGRLGIVVPEVNAFAEEACKDTAPSTTRARNETF